MKMMNGQNEKKCNEGGDDLKNNACCECKEGYVFGEDVYCSIDGRFHPLRDNLLCKSFVPIKPV